MVWRRQMSPMTLMRLVKFVITVSQYQAVNEGLSKIYLAIAINAHGPPPSLPAWLVPARQRTSSPCGRKHAGTPQVTSYRNNGVLPISTVLVTTSIPSPTSTSSSRLVFSLSQYVFTFVISQTMPSRLFAAFIQLQPSTTSSSETSLHMLCCIR